VKLFGIETELILRIFMGGTVRREFRLCEKSMKLGSVLMCYDVVCSVLAV